MPLTPKRTKVSVVTGNDLCCEFFWTWNRLRHYRQAIKELAQDGNARCQNNCIGKYFDARHISPVDGSTALTAALNCEYCRTMLNLLDERREVRRKFAGLKRRIYNHGKRETSDEP